MNISTVFIKKPIMTVLLVVTVLAFGIISYFELPISALPSVDSPVITITAYLPGASPETMASAVASPIENQCMQISGLESILSTNTSGSTQITLTFDLNTNVDLAAPDVQAALSRAQGNLPSLPNPPQYTKYNPSDYDLVFYANIDSDSLREKVHFWLDGETIKRGITKPSSDPVSYDIEEQITEIAHYVVNIKEASPLFLYYDEDFTGSESSLESPINIPEIKSIKIQLEIEKDEEKTPIPLHLESLVQIRNLKEN